MQRIVTTGMVVLLLCAALPSHSVRAASFSYNDPHGQWSLILPDAYKRTDGQYNIGDKDHPGFNALTAFSSLDGRNVSVSYRECCHPDPAKLKQLVQEDFDARKKVNPDAEIGADGIQSTTLGDQPAIRLDYFFTVQGSRLHWRTIGALSGGLAYGLRFFTTDTAFDSMANDIAAISDSFRFYGRSITAGIYNDPQGRFIFTVPPQYDLVPNFLGEIDDNEISAATFSPNPIAEDNADAHIFVETYPDKMTFDSRFDVYAHAGLRTLAEKGAEIGLGGVRHTTLDGHPAGVMDFYLSSDTGIRFHAFQAFTVLNGTQYFIFFGFPEGVQGSPVNPVDVILASFHFQSPLTTATADIATWIDPKGLIQLQYPSDWFVTIEAGSDSSVLELIGQDGTYFHLDIYDPQSEATLADEAQDDLDGDTGNTKFTYVDGPVTDTMVGGEPALTYPFTYTAKNKANAQTYNGRRWDVNHGGKEFVLTGDANTTHQAQIDAIVASFTFIR